MWLQQHCSVQLLWIRIKLLLIFCNLCYGSYNTIDTARYVTSLNVDVHFIITIIIAVDQTLSNFSFFL